MKSIVKCLLLIFVLQFSNNCDAQENIALHKPVSVSSEDKAYPAKNITDGVISRTSKWQAGTNKAPHIVEINLLKYYNISQIKVHSGILDKEKQANETTQAAGFWSAKNFKLQYWDDANWSDFPKGEVHENRLVSAVFNFNPVVTYKIRLVCDDGEAINIMEMEVMGVLSPNMPAPPDVKSDISKNTKPKGPQYANISVSPKVIGKTMKYVGYNQGYYFPGSNVSGWLKYSNANSLRVWTSLNSFVPDETVQFDDAVNSVEIFDERKAALRKSPEKNQFIKWDDLYPLYDRVDSSSTNAMVYNYVLDELKKLNIKVVLQMGAIDYSDKWSNKWRQWQKYYALAYYSAKRGDVEMFAMHNEPNHVNAGPVKLDDWIKGNQIFADAIHCAVEDAGKANHKNLTGLVVGPVTAGQNTDWWAAISEAIKTDYHGKKVAQNQVDIFDTHSYNSPAMGYEHRIDNIREIIKNNNPEGKAIPIVYTEIGRWMNAYLIDKEETMDSPSLFTEWAGIYSNNMKNDAYGMWAFKFANTASSTYPRGIKSGHHLIWQGQRIVEDAYKNLALNKKVSASSSASSGQFVTDGDKSDASAWMSGDGSEAEKSIIIDLGAKKNIGYALIYTGSDGGMFTAPDRIKNFKLQYFQNGMWLDIPGAKEKNCRYAQVFIKFKQAVETDKVRFLSTDAGNLKVRELKLFAEGDGPAKQPDYNVSGIQRTGEVVRLFAKGFKNERNLLETKVSNTDTDLDAYTSYDSESGNYYIWLVQRGSSAYHLKLNLAALKLPVGTPITAETVNDLNYGEVTDIITTTANGLFDYTLTPQSVVLLTIPSGKQTKITVNATEDSKVTGGDKSNANFGKDEQIAVALDASNPSNNQVSYIKFKSDELKAGQIEKCLLAVNGAVTSGEKPFRLHVYAFTGSNWNQHSINWNNAPHLDKTEALIHNVGQQVDVAGELAFTKKSTYHYLDVTELLKSQSANEITFVLVRETRQIGDDEDKGRKVILSSSESSLKPHLEIWK